MHRRRCAALAIVLAGCQPCGGRGATRQPARARLKLAAGVPFAHLDVRVVDDETGAPLPARLVVRPEPGAGYGQSLTSGSPNRRAPGSMHGTDVAPGVVGSTDGVLLVHGAGVVPIPPGRWRLLVTRGPEYEAVEREITLGPSQRAPLLARLRRVVDTRGWLSAELHLHSEHSFDTKVPIDHQAIAAVCNGVELPVLTDHHFIDSLAASALRLGYGPDLAGFLGGVEIGVRHAHVTSYPLRPRPDQEFGGAPPWLEADKEGCKPGQPAVNCVTLRDGIAAVRGLAPGNLVVLAHPIMPNSDLGFFTNHGWGYGLPRPPPAPIEGIDEFDGIELLNATALTVPIVEWLLGDWFWLIGRGRRLVAVAGSDSHVLSTARAGWPRTWVRLPDETPGETTGEAFASALHGGHAIVSSGPFLRLRARGAEPGDTLVLAEGGDLEVEVTADAPSFIALDELTLFVNGRESARVAVPSWTRHPRLVTRFTVPIVHDSFIVAVVAGKQPIAPEIAGFWFDMPAIAITNPIFIDANADGRWSPPAVPVVIPRLYAKPATPARRTSGAVPGPPPRADAARVPALPWAPTERR